MFRWFMWNYFYLFSRFTFCFLLFFYIFRWKPFRMVFIYHSIEFPSNLTCSQLFKWKFIFSTSIRVPSMNEKNKTMLKATWALRLSLGMQDKKNEFFFSFFFLFAHIKHFSRPHLIEITVDIFDRYFVISKVEQKLMKRNYHWGSISLFFSFGERVLNIQFMISLCVRARVRLHSFFKIENCSVATHIALGSKCHKLPSLQMEKWKNFYPNAKKKKILKWKLSLKKIYWSI